MVRSVRTSIVTSGIQLLCTGLTFVFGIFMASLFGSSSDMDAYVVSANIIGIIYSLFTFSQSNVLIPYLGGIKDKETQNSVAVSIIHFNNIAFTITALILFLASRILMEILAPGLSAEQKDLGAVFIKITSLYLFLSNLAGLGKGIVELHLKPILSQIFKLLQAITLVVTLFVIHDIVGIFSLPWSHTISVGITIPFYLFYFKKQNIRILSTFSVWSSQVKAYLSLLIPILVGQLLMRAIKLSDSFLASFLNEGALSQMNYSLRIVTNFNILFSGIYLVYFPLLSNLSSNDENKEHYRVFKEGFEFLFWAVLAFSVFFILYAPEVVQGVFERGSFTHKDTVVVANISRAYMMMIICSPLGTYFANMYYSRKDSKRAAIYSAISSITNIVLNFVLVRVWGVYGLAIASSCAYFLGNLLQLCNMKKLNPAFSLRDIFVDSIVRITFVVAVPLIAVAALKFTLARMWQSILSPWLHIFIAGLVYAILLIITTYISKLTFFADLITGMSKKKRT